MLLVDDGHISFSGLVAAMRVESKKCFSPAGRRGCYNRLPIVLIIHQQFDTKFNKFVHLFNIICYELDRKQIMFASESVTLMNVCEDAE